MRYSEAEEIVRRWILTTAVFVCACTFDGGGVSGEGVDAAAVDGAVDAGEPFRCQSWSEQQPTHFSPCQIPEPLDHLDIDEGSWFLDSTNGSLLDHEGDTLAVASTELPSQLTGGGPIRVLSVRSFTVRSGAELRVTGANPLVIASWTTIEVSGSIDATSDVPDGPLRGPGAIANACNLAGNGEATPGELLLDGGAGGGGGGFGTSGGQGADGPVDAVTGATPARGAGGAARPPPAFLRGGCAGGSGGNGPSGVSIGGTGGRGGGAIELAALDTITIVGAINAGGAGGDGGRGNPAVGPGGGGGGGSGGMIFVDAPRIVTQSGSVLAANGGGGGEGGEAGQGGEDGEVGGQSGPAAGGSDVDSGGDGGDGAVDQTPGGDGDTADSGGGGGGGVGVILLHAASVDAQGQSSPPAAPTP